MSVNACLPCNLCTDTVTLSHRLQVHPPLLPSFSFPYLRGLSSCSTWNARLGWPCRSTFMFVSYVHLPIVKKIIIFKSF